ncbi:MAG: 50S ribosomal protein L17 [Candidatus Makaraimicrobium thalassicum]|nr:MAG: 50S ribosomal protein L17 [Candidatus Omnitrophota bacterium]
MRHRKKKGRLNRRTSYRKATLKSLANDLLMYQRIETTMAKAKALKSYAEPLITLAKNKADSISARRQAFQKLCDKSVVKSLFDDLAPLYKGVPGGYTRIMPLGIRKGDGAQTVIIELTRRTIPDEKLLRTGEKKKKAKVAEKARRSKKEEEPKKAAVEPEAGTKHAAPEVKIEEKEKRSVEDVRKEKAKTEQKKINKKGIFRIFRRKSMG